jgi:hypothetical protein
MELTTIRVDNKDDMDVDIKINAICCLKNHLPPQPLVTTLPWPSKGGDDHTETRWWRGEAIRATRQSRCMS